MEKTKFKIAKEENGQLTKDVKAKERSEEKGKQAKEVNVKRKSGDKANEKQSLTEISEVGRNTYVVCLKDYDED
ncbi:unnamed protein product [Parnassius apollo]|uniref:(apollo) hypothetical protein n=1 Tax=Parnassius apollo TaxID=110799 RepID=A0A8S3X4H9_PARAO|nr:unnamed protein product [Parnassius apollo]